MKSEEKNIRNTINQEIQKVAKELSNPEVKPVTRTDLKALIKEIIEQLKAEDEKKILLVKDWLKRKRKKQDGNSNSKKLA